MSIGDLHSKEPGSAARYNDGKPQLSLIPLEYLEGEARVWMHGAKKYAAWNWRKGMPWSEVINSLMRHLAAFQAGEDFDPESGLPHIDHIACNVRMLQVFRVEYRQGDDRFVVKRPPLCAAEQAPAVPVLLPLPSEEAGTQPLPNPAR